MNTRQFWFLPVLAFLVCGLASCSDEVNKANQEQIQLQQKQIEENERAIAELKAGGTYAGATMPPPGGCDSAVMHQATSQGDAKYSEGAYVRALGYYQDALVACAGNARAEYNLGRTYEAMGNESKAVEHYQIAANSNDSQEQEAVNEAHAALDRLGAASR
ncbi:MAG TPA: hypothetical protein VKE70_32260 [Candidatus Solibacter sp.]|nr:hypothetical protein [Candidatus Solibacter sp.]